MELQLKATGLLLIILAIFHIAFPKYFKWKEEFGSVSMINRQMMYVHTFFIGVILILMGVLCLTSTSDLMETDLGKKVSLGIGIFWGFRLIIQFFGYSAKLWKGKTFETAIHITFSVLWIYLTTLFFLVALR